MPAWQIYRRCSLNTLLLCFQPARHCLGLRSISPNAFLAFASWSFGIIGLHLLTVIHGSANRLLSAETSQASRKPPALVILMHWSLMWLLFNEKQASKALVSYYVIIDLKWRMCLVEVNSFTQVINPLNQILKSPWPPSLAKKWSLFLSRSPAHLFCNLL